MVARMSQIGVLSPSPECPGHGVHARVAEVKHWIQLLAQGAEDTNCKQDIPFKPGIDLRCTHKLTHNVIV